MKKITIPLAGATAIFLAVAQNSNAVPITGNIGFSGSVQLNSGSVATATTAVNWFGTQITDHSTSGDFFTEFGSGGGQSVTIAMPWSFNSGALASFWSVGSAPNFTFNLLSSTVASNDGTFLNVLLHGTVSAIGFDTTVFDGTFQVANPSANGISTFTERLSFNPGITRVPDGGTTAVLLGAAVTSLAFIKRKALA